MKLKAEQELKKIEDFLALENAVPSGGHTPVDEILGLLRVARMQRDQAQNEALALAAKLRTRMEPPR